MTTGRKIGIGLSALLLLGGGFFLWRSLAKGSTRVHPLIAPVVESVYGLGTVEAARHFDLRLGVNSTITQLWVKEGDDVKKGALILELDDVNRIRAPFAGTITSLPFNIGENVFPQDTVFKLVDLNDLYVNVALEQRTLVRINRGQNARISIENLRGERVQGRVKSIYPQNNQFWVRIDAEAFPPSVLPEMTVDVAIEVRKQDQATLIPFASIRNNRVRIIREKRKMEIPVTYRNVDDQLAEILTGDIQPTDWVLVPRG